MTKTRLRHPFALLLCCLLAAEVHGNGINPPRPSGTKTIQATCTDRKSGTVKTIQRARIAIGEPSGTLELRVDRSRARTLQLSQVNRVEIPSAKPTPDGLAKVSMDLLDPTYTGPGFIRLREKGKPVRLVGFTVDLERVDIPLEACKELTLKALTLPETEPGEVSKK
jgi:hypothetical protein